jgi:hypothetical protein
MEDVSVSEFPRILEEFEEYVLDSSFTERPEHEGWIERFSAA